ncbi:hypothetical protein FHG87_000489 [Trinorchestia longiramus]|nr:hypothetical protein FHG87_000489 [Trinorchestia longiramus]
MIEINACDINACAGCIESFLALCSESHGSTTNEYCDDASFHRPMSKQDRRSESSDEARPRCPVTTRNTPLTNERSRSDSRAQPTAQYMEAATLCVTDSLPSASKVNISANNSQLPRTLPTAERRKQKSIILSADRMGSNNLRTNKKCTYSNSTRAPTLYWRLAGKI